MLPGIVETGNLSVLTGVPERRVREGMDSGEEELKCCVNCQFIREIETACNKLVLFCIITEKLVEIGDCCDHWRYDGELWEVR